MVTSIVLLIAITIVRASNFNNRFDTMTQSELETTELPEPLTESSIYYISQLDAQHFDDQEARTSRKNISAAVADATKNKNQKRKNAALNEAVRVASIQGLNAMIDLYERKEPEILRKGQHIKQNVINCKILKSIAKKISYFR